MSMCSIRSDRFHQVTRPSLIQAQSQRRVAVPTANSTFGVGVGTPGTLVNSSLGSGWQVWGGAAPPQRNVSASSAPATTDLSNQAEMSFRPSMTEGWRPANGTWADDDAGEFSLGRPRQVSVAQGVTFSPHTDDRPLGGSKPSFSPQRFDVNLNKDPTTTPRYTSPQPTTFSAPPFSSQQAAQGHPMGYDPSRSPSAVDNLALGIRGMTVEDDASLSLSQHNSPYRGGTHVSTGVPNAVSQVRTAPLQHRGPYTGFPPPEYAPYYPGTPTDPSMYTPSPVTPSAVPANMYPHMVCSTTTQDLLDLRVLSSITLHNQHYIILVIHLYSPLTLLFMCLQ
ncbi:hypothetical protein BJV78DRAFT_301994 [Lactifluus subvellereus]|nr:hypothetical protein BJV78DRAFT_301994 [Lactifluus subvellereus]